MGEYHTENEAFPRPWVLLDFGAHSMFIRRILLIVDRLDAR